MREDLQTNDTRGEDDPLHTILTRLAALFKYGGNLAAAKVDSVKLQVRNALIFAVLGLLAFVVLMATLVSLVVYTLRGVAGGLQAMLGADRAWLADLLAGLIGFAVLIGCVAIMLAVLKSKLRNATVTKYERRRTVQRSNRREREHDTLEPA